jgi:hypothetical protein
MKRNTVIDSYRKLPPHGAFILFNGVDLNNWITRKGRPAQWTITNKMLDVVPGAGDIMTVERWMDFCLDLEFRCPNMPGSKGQGQI